MNATDEKPMPQGFPRAEKRLGSLFGAHHGSVKVRMGIDLTAPLLDCVPDAETGR